MSMNCIRCVINQRTGGDLLCDKCRHDKEHSVPDQGPLSAESLPRPSVAHAEREEGKLGNETPRTQTANNVSGLAEREVREHHRNLPSAPLDLGRLINSLPPEVNKKLSLHDLKRVANNYNTGPCPNCYGGHFRPCQWCGDTGMVTVSPTKEKV